MVALDEDVPLEADVVLDEDVVALTSAVRTGAVAAVRVPVAVDAFFSWA
ncbi:hypothetical protein GCM10009638_21480 [Luteococcus sanguinis]